MSRLQMTETNPSNLKLFFQVATGEGGGVINLLTIYPFFAMQFQVIQFGFFTINGFKLFYCQKFSKISDRVFGKKNNHAVIY